MKLRFAFVLLCACAGTGAAVGCLGSAFSEGSGGATSSASSSAASTGAAGAAASSTSHASSSSAASSSGTLLCDLGQTPCGAKCFDLQADPNHCGACTDSACANTEVCSMGSCACRPGFTKCQVAATSLCADLQHDPKHCGSCTDTCKAGEVCVPGNGGMPSTCSPAACPGGTTDCDGGCYQSFDNTQLACGNCGDACSNVQACAGGKCETAFVVAACAACTTQSLKCCSSGPLTFCYDPMGSCPGN
jgi:hypothetical protein